MKGPVERLADAGRIFSGHLAGDVPWEDRTPCRGWNVRDLVNHLAAEMLWAPPLVDGLTIADVGDRFDGDVLGDDPARAYSAAHEAAVAAFAEEGALERTVNLSSGDGPAGDYCDELAVDALLHSWDLARSVDDDDLLPVALVEWALPWVVVRQEALSATGLYGTIKAFTPDGRKQDELLARLGRRKDWRKDYVRDQS